jgi:hypothetical protein
MIETRILPLPHAHLPPAFVTMPRTAWYWLDDLVETNYPRGGYRALVREFEKADTKEQLEMHLSQTARRHEAVQMAALYNLANDNSPAARPCPAATPIPERPMPICYLLFRFLAHATTLTTLWERRNYHLKP